MKTQQAIADLKEVLEVYRKLYEERDPEGEIAVHIEFDVAAEEAISYLEERIK